MRNQRSGAHGGFSFRLRNEVTLDDRVAWYRVRSGRARSKAERVQTVAQRVQLTGRSQARAGSRVRFTVEDHFERQGRTYALQVRRRTGWKVLAVKTDPEFGALRFTRMFRKPGVRAVRVVARPLNGAGRNVGETVEIRIRPAR